MKISLRPVTPNDAEFLYEMLRERTPEVSISHREMPTMAEHCAFMAKDPYHVWYIIEAGDGVPVGQTYLTRENEIGIFVKAAFHGKGIGTQAVQDLMEMHKRDRYIANIAPKNEKSLAFFGGKGFKLIQMTFERRPT